MNATKSIQDPLIVAFLEWGVCVLQWNRSLSTALFYYYFYMKTKTILELFIME